MTFALEHTGSQKTHESHSADTDVWLTPPYLKAPLGEFDLDPCAAINQPWPTAKTHYTKADNGLLKPWFGRVWLNPPYGAEANKWLKRLAEHGEGTALIFARTETKSFFDYVWDVAVAVLFIRGRVKFCYPDGRQCPTNAGAPSCLVAYGYHDFIALLASRHTGKLVALRH